ncbi:Peptidoglycan-binding domain 1 protein [Methylocella silvestris BL2]|uniref:Peptidoglycan-binding domain 1 protein n=1 Tax=Methylocella silvestris (strain DSM 15510 / CIP 108128 / LMG 27833 / NCIMB 13906 / BL2) TaxID=395965 RepID=B8EK77_METSB|nr:peptidoglycan-binding domain-containing protein [Methylocella silvestris]ACK50617.1 Peptidoglycan-binding domain 1 protein [Methylocella silvestris BL2]
MREALAAADHDFILSEAPRPRPRARRAGGAGARKRASPHAGRTTRRLFGVIASALCVAALGGIVINALTLQRARHPAPLFGAVKERVAEPQAAAPPPVPAPRPQQFAPVRAETEAAGAAEDKPAPRPREAQAPAPANPAPQAKPHDAISELLLTGAAHEAPPAASKSVLAAQKALVKLGYVLKPDGVMGASTRQAIERYERDRGRAPHGELTPALARALSAESGLPIN